MAELTPQVRATEYTVSMFPDEHSEQRSFSVTIRERGPGKWAVMHFSECYDADLKCEYESSPSNRSDDFKERFRFDLDTAIEIAKRLAPRININGLTAQVWHDRFDEPKIDE